MHKLKALRENLCDELEKVAKREGISTSDLDVIDKLAHSIKNLDKVILGNEMIEEYGYDFSDRYYSGARRGRDGDGDGRYSESRGRSYADRSYDNHSYERNYSGHNEPIDRFKHMMQDAVNQL